MARSKQNHKIKIIPLGGMGEVGKNLTVIEYMEKMIIIDCGMTFPDDDMLGIDVCHTRHHIPQAEPGEAVRHLS